MTSCCICTCIYSVYRMLEICIAQHAHEHTHTHTQTHTHTHTPDPPLWEVYFPWPPAGHSNCMGGSREEEKGKITRVQDTCPVVNAHVRQVSNHTQRLLNRKMIKASKREGCSVSLLGERSIQPLPPSLLSFTIPCSLSLSLTA